MQLTWQWVLGIAAAFLAMRIGGLIANFWVIIGIIGFLVILWLLQSLPAYKRAVTAAFVIWVSVFFGLPMLGIALRADWPILSDAMRRRSLDAELKAAEWLDPMALRARIGISRYCRQLDNMQGEWLSQRLEELRQSVEPPVQPGFLTRIGIALGLADPPQRPPFPRPVPRDEQNVLHWLQIIEQHRLDCKALVLQTNTPAKPAEPSGGWSYRRWFWIAVMVLAAAGLISRFTGWKALSSAAWGLAALLLVALLADWLVWGGGFNAVRAWAGEERGASIRGRPSEVVELHPVAYAGPWYLVGNGECIVNPIGGYTDVLTDIRRDPIRLIPGKPRPIPMEKKFFIRGQGLAEIVISREPGCRRVGAVEAPLDQGGPEIRKM